MKAKVIILGAFASFLFGCQTVSSEYHGSAPFQTIENSRTLVIGSKKEYSINYVPDPTGKASSSMVERFELRNGDCAGKDCTGQQDGSYRERVENNIAMLGKGWGLDSTVWYGFDFYFDTDTAEQFEGHEASTTLGQIKAGFFNNQNIMREGGCGAPLIMTRFHKGLVYVDLTVDGGRGGDADSKPFLVGVVKEMANQWNRWEIQTAWTRKESGLLNVWLNGKQVIAYEGPTYNLCSREPMQFATFKYGVYSTYHPYNNWYGKVTRDEPFSNPEVRLDTRVVLYDNISIAKTRDGLFRSGD